MLREPAWWHRLPQVFWWYLLQLQTVSDDKAGTGKMATAQLQSPVKSHSHCYLFVNDLHEEEPLPGYQVSTNKAGIRASLC